MSESTENQLLRSFASAETTAAQYPQYATQITDAARDAFVKGQHWAYLAGSIAIVLGAAVVFFCFPRHDEERRLLAGYAAEAGDA